MLHHIETTAAPTPAGHYAQAMCWNDLIFVAGQLPIAPDGKKVLGTIGEQTRQTLENLRAILDAAGSDLQHVLKTTVYVTDIALWNDVNAIYAQYFGDHKPARAIVPVKELHYGFFIEIEAIAVKKS